MEKCLHLNVTSVLRHFKNIIFPTLHYFILDRSFVTLLIERLKSIHFLSDFFYLK